VRARHPQRPVALVITSKCSASVPHPLPETELMFQLLLSAGRLTAARQSDYLPPNAAHPPLPP
jgi:hypothetical protein